MTLTLELSAEREAVLNAKAQAQGLTAEQYARLVLEENLNAHDGGEPKTDGRHISEIMAEIMADVPPEEFAKLPKDGASEHDHYLYGHPKRSQ
jgi:hypothetical protein